MRQSGFTLVELVVVIGIIAILLVIGTLQFKTYTQKAGIEQQIKTLYADLATVRAQALYRKRDRTVKITAAGYSIYSSTVVSVTPVQQATFKSSVNPANLRIDFDSQGIGTFDGDGTIADAAVCVQGENPAVVDSIALSRSQVRLGKLKDGMGCAFDNIDPK